MENLLMFILPCLFMGTTLYGANQTKAKDPSGANILAPGVLGGNVKTMIDYYEMLGTESSADIIEVGKQLPKGARVLSTTILTEDLADTCTLHLGDYEDVDRYMSSIDGTAVGRFTTVEALTTDSLAYEVDETNSGKTIGSGIDSQLILTFATLAATLNTGARVTVVITYTHE